MSAILEAVRDKPVALFQMDDSAPFQDYSGYAKTGTTVSGTPTTGVSLANGAVYSTVFNRSVVGKFDNPVFRQGQEDKSFSLESWVYPIRKTTGYTAQTYRENRVLNPAATTMTSIVSIGSINGTNTFANDSSVPSGKYVRETWVSGNSSMGFGYMTGTVEVGTYAVSYWVRTNKTTFNAYNIEGTAGVSSGNWTTTTASNVWTKSTGVITVTTTGTLKLGGYISASASGDYVDISSPLVEKVSVFNPYFDGNMPGYEWAGTANNSISKTRTDISRVNLVPIPDMEETVSVDSGWIANAGTTTSKDTGVKLAGSRSQKFVTTTENWGYYPMDGGPNRPLRAIGQQYTVSVYVYANTAQNLSLFDYGTSNTRGPIVAVSANTWTRLSVTFTAGTNVFLSVRDPNRVNVVGTIYLDNFMIESGTGIGAYFDGNSPGAVWFGTPSASTSLMYISDGEQQMLGHTGQYDGLTINGTKVSFTTKYLTSGECRVTHDLQINRRVHVVGIHTSDKNMLFVDGELVDETEVTEAQKVDSYVATDDFLYSGATLSSMNLALNNVGVYATALSSDSIMRHFKSGSQHVPRNSIPSQFGGTRIPFTQDEADVFLEQTWATKFDWESASLTDVVVENDRLKPALRAGISEPGTWVDVFPMSASGVTSIYGVNMLWDGEGAIVEASLDGTTWEAVERGKNLSIIPPGLNPTNQDLAVRVRFAGGVLDDPAFIDNLTVTGFRTGVSPVIAGRTVTYTAPAYTRNDHEPAELTDDWGTNLNGGTITIGADTSIAPLHPRTIEVWFKQLPGAQLTRNFTATVGFYHNGITWNAGPQVGEWSIIHLTNTDPVAFDLIIGGDVLVGQVVLYEDTLTSAQVNEIYRAYVGFPKAAVVDGSVIGMTEPAQASTIYDYDWSISASG